MTRSHVLTPASGTSRSARGQQQPQQDSDDDSSSFAMLPPSRSRSSGGGLAVEDLPLRPSVLERLVKSGFYTTEEIEDVRARGGLRTLAAQFGVTPSEAAAMLREVQTCMSEHNVISQPSSQSDQSQEEGDDHRTPSAAKRKGRGASKTVVIPGSSVRDSMTSLDASKQEEDDDEIIEPILSIPSDAPVLSVPTARDLLEARSRSSSQKVNHIITFSRSIDMLMGGGVPLGSLTEVVGPPGCGKTQMAMQLCVDACLPAGLGGVQGQAVYIDTEGSFSPERCASMALALVKHVERTSRKDPNIRAQLERAAEAFTAKSILDRIHVFRALDDASQLSTIEALPHIIDEQTKASSAYPIRLVIIDSMAFHLRCSPRGENGADKDFFKRRTNMLFKAASMLNRLAELYDVAVVTVNHMTTKFLGGNSNEPASTAEMVASAMNGGSVGSTQIPALGESWAHAVTTRMMLSHGMDGRRTCSLQKSPNRPSGTAPFRILDIGVRDIVYEEPSSHKRQRISDV